MKGSDFVIYSLVLHQKGILIDCLTFINQRKRLPQRLALHYSGEKESDIGLISGIVLQYFMYRQINCSCYVVKCLDYPNDLNCRNKQRKYIAKGVEKLYLRFVAYCVTEICVLRCGCQLLVFTREVDPPTSLFSPSVIKPKIVTIR